MTLNRERDADHIHALHYEDEPAAAKAYAHDHETLVDEESVLELLTDTERSLLCELERLVYR